MNIPEALANLPANLLVGALGIVALLILFIPLTLRVAGLTGQQISDLIALTLQFFLSLAKEFRDQNKTP